MDWTNKLNARQPPLGFNPQTPMNNAIQSNPLYVSPYTSPQSGQRSVFLPPQPLLPPKLNGDLIPTRTGNGTPDKSDTNPEFQILMIDIHIIYLLYLYIVLIGVIFQILKLIVLHYRLIKRE